MTTVHPANIDIAAALGEAEESYRERNPKSLVQHQAACEAMPGGNTRSAIHVDPFPLTMVRGEGARLWDLDGHEYVDFLSEFTAGIFGHSHPAILKAITQAIDEYCEDKRLGPISRDTIRRALNERKAGLAKQRG